MKISDLINKLNEIKNKHGDLDLVQFRNHESNILNDFSSDPDVVGVNIEDTSWGGKETILVTYDPDLDHDKLCVLMN